MNVSIEYLPEFTVIGKLGQGKSEEGPKWIVPLWEEANGAYCQMENSVRKTEEGAPKTMWGIMGNPTEFLGRWTEDGLYLAGCEADKDAKAPEGFTKWAVPAQTYLVADCSQEAYGMVFHHVIEKYMPQHGLSMIGAAHERYPEPQNPAHVILYFPIANDSLYCQSCGMPLHTDAELGSETNGEKSYDYCSYCYQNGSFTDDRTMEEMVEFCLNYEGSSDMYTDKEQARKQMCEWYPTLKRWKK